MLPIRIAALCLALLAGACTMYTPDGPTAERLALSRQVAEMYGAVLDDGWTIPAVTKIESRNIRQVVDNPTGQPAGTIVVDPRARFLYLVMEGGKAMRYGVGVGQEGMDYQGEAVIARKATWPRWTPTPDMIARNPDRYEKWAGGMDGGLGNPLGARALYLYQGGQDTLYRIHGTNEPWSIGQAVSSGCIRMLNQDAIDLYQRVPDGTRVVVLPA